MKIKIVIKRNNEYTLTEKWFEKDWNDIEIIVSDSDDSD